MRPRRAAAREIRILNLEEGKPLVHQALAHLEKELKLARTQGIAILKLIHGYGSTGAGGEIRIAVQKRLRELADDHQIQACIFGEDWTPSHERTWALLKTQPALKSDPHLGKRNLGITIVVL